MPRLVIDISTNRVIYFTEDMEKLLTLNQHTAMRDWLEPLPADMKLNNCWDWRLKGDTLEYTVKDPAPAETLLEQNKKNVRQLLMDRINAARKPHFSAYVGNDWIKNKRIEEANAGGGPLLLAEAATKNKELSVLIREVLDADRTFSQVMIKTETLKIQYQKAINEATEESVLWELRDEIANTNYLTA
jgi:hypothetical protein